MLIRPIRDSPAAGGVRVRVKGLYLHELTPVTFRPAKTKKDPAGKPGLSVF